MRKFDTLTKAEMQIMSILWELPHGGCIHEIISLYPEPKPAYTTISTFLKILHSKGFVDYKKLKGKTYTYYPLVSRNEYTSTVMKDVKNSFFGGSVSSMVKFFVEKEEISEKDIKELLDMIKKQ